MLHWWLIGCNRLWVHFGRVKSKKEEKKATFVKTCNKIRCCVSLEIGLSRFKSGTSDSSTTVTNNQRQTEIWNHGPRYSITLIQTRSPKCIINRDSAGPPFHVSCLIPFFLYFYQQKFLLFYYILLYKNDIFLLYLNWCEY